MVALGHHQLPGAALGQQPGALLEPSDATLKAIAQQVSGSQVTTDGVRLGLPAMNLPACNPADNRILAIAAAVSSSPRMSEGAASASRLSAIAEALSKVRGPSPTANNTRPSPAAVPMNGGSFRCEPGSEERFIGGPGSPPGAYRLEEAEDAWSSSGAAGMAEGAIEAPGSPLHGQCFSEEQFIGGPGSPFEDWFMPLEEPAGARPRPEHLRLGGQLLDWDGRPLAAFSPSSPPAAGIKDVHRCLDIAFPRQCPDDDKPASVRLFGELPNSSCSPCPASIPAVVCCAGEVQCTRHLTAMGPAPAQLWKPFVDPCFGNDCAVDAPGSHGDGDAQDESHGEQDRANACDEEGEQQEEEQHAMPPGIGLVQPASPGDEDGVAMEALDHDGQSPQESRSSSPEPAVDAPDPDRDAGFEKTLLPGSCHPASEGSHMSVGRSASLSSDGRSPAPVLAVHSASSSSAGSAHDNASRQQGSPNRSQRAGRRPSLAAPGRPPQEGLEDVVPQQGDTDSSGRGAAGPADSPRPQRSERVHLFGSLPRDEIALRLDAIKLAEARDDLTRRSEGGESQRSHESPKANARTPRQKPLVAPSARVRRTMEEVSGVRRSRGERGHRGWASERSDRSNLASSLPTPRHGVEAASCRSFEDFIAHSGAPVGAPAAQRQQPAVRRQPSAPFSSRLKQWEVAEQKRQKKIAEAREAIEQNQAAECTMKPQLCRASMRIMKQRERRKTVGACEGAHDDDAQRSLTPDFAGKGACAEEEAECKKVASPATESGSEDAAQQKTRSNSLVSMSEDFVEQWAASKGPSVEAQSATAAPEVVPLKAPLSARRSPAYKPECSFRSMGDLVGRSRPVCSSGGVAEKKNEQPLEATSSLLPIPTAAGPSGASPRKADVEYDRRFKDVLARATGEMPEGRWRLDGRRRKADPW